MDNHYACLFGSFLFWFLLQFFVTHSRVYNIAVTLGTDSNAQTAGDIYFRLFGTRNIWSDWFIHNGFSASGTTYSWDETVTPSVGTVTKVVVLSKQTDGFTLNTVEIDNTDSYTIVNPSYSYGADIDTVNGGTECSYVIIYFNGTAYLDRTSTYASGNANCDLDVNENPTPSPTSDPTVSPTLEPSMQPSSVPSKEPSLHPSFNPSMSPSHHPSAIPSIMPSDIPTSVPTYFPSVIPTIVPTDATESPTISPSDATNSPSKIPSIFPTKIPSVMPTDITSNDISTSTDDTSNTNGNGNDGNDGNSDSNTDNNNNDSNGNTNGNDQVTEVDSNNSGTGTDVTLIVILSIGGVGAIAICVCLVLFVLYRRKSNTDHQKAIALQSVYSGTTSVNASNKKNHEMQSSTTFNSSYMTPSGEMDSNTNHYHGGNNNSGNFVRVTGTSAKVTVTTNEDGNGENSQNNFYNKRNSNKNKIQNNNNNDEYNDLIGGNSPITPMSPAINALLFSGNQRESVKANDGMLVTGLSNVTDDGSSNEKNGLNGNMKNRKYDDDDNEDNDEKMVEFVTQGLDLVGEIMNVNDNDNNNNEDDSSSSSEAELEQIRNAAMMNQRINIQQPTNVLMNGHALNKSNVNNNNNSNNNYGYNNSNGNVTRGRGDSQESTELHVEIAKMIEETDAQNGNGSNNNNSDNNKKGGNFGVLLNDGLMVQDMVVDDIIDEMNDEANGIDVNATPGNNDQLAIEEGEGGAAAASSQPNQVQAFFTPM